MKYTPIFAHYRKLLADINDLVWFHQFALAEVEAGVQRWSPRVKQLQTTDVFGGNPYVARCNVRLAHFDGFKNRLSSSAFGSAFAASYEHFCDYREEAFGLLGRLGRRRPLVEIDARTPEKSFAVTLSKAGYPALSQELTETQAYLRMRRNHHAHAAQALDPKFRAFLRNRGAALTLYWKSTANIALDFSSEEIFSPVIEETIGLLRVILRLITDLDLHLALCFDELRVIDDGLDHVKAERKRHTSKPLAKNADVVAKLARRIGEQLQADWGWQPDRATIEQAIWRKRF